MARARRAPMATAKAEVGEHVEAYWRLHPEGDASLLELVMAIRALAIDVPGYCLGDLPEKVRRHFRRC